MSFLSHIISKTHIARYTKMHFWKQLQSDAVFSRSCYVLFDILFFKLHSRHSPEKNWALKPFLETVLSDLNSMRMLLYWEVMASGFSAPQNFPCSLESADSPLLTSTKSYLHTCTRESKPESYSSLQFTFQPLLVNRIVLLVQLVELSNPKRLSFQQGNIIVALLALFSALH